MNLFVRNRTVKAAKIKKRVKNWVEIRNSWRLKKNMVYGFTFQGECKRLEWIIIKRIKRSAQISRSTWSPMQQFCNKGRVVWKCLSLFSFFLVMWTWNHFIIANNVSNTNRQTIWSIAVSNQDSGLDLQTDMIYRNLAQGGGGGGLWKQAWRDVQGSGWAAAPDQGLN